MIVGIIGPSDIKGFCKAVNIDNSEFISKISEIAKKVANLGHEIVIVPQKNSVSEVFALEYKKNNGKKIIGIIPMDDTEFGIEKLNQEIVDEISNCVTWRNQPPRLAEESEILLCLGFSAGTLTEVFATKYYNNIKTLIIEDFINSKIPIEIEKDINLIYIKSEEVTKYL